MPTTGRLSGAQSAFPLLGGLGRDAGVAGALAIVARPGLDVAAALVGQLLRFALDGLAVELQVGRSHRGRVDQVDTVVEADLCHVVFLDALWLPAANKVHQVGLARSRKNVGPLSRGTRKLVRSVFAVAHIAILH